MESGRDRDEERRSRTRHSFREAEEHFDGLGDPVVKKRRREPGPKISGGRRAVSGETMKRILIAIPWIAFTIAIIVAGGLIFTLAMIAIGVALPARVPVDDRRVADRLRSRPTRQSRHWSSPPTSARRSTCC